jgi:hypothetical protein
MRRPRCDSDGRVGPGPTRWRRSRNQRETERKLAEALRRESAHRTTLHGQLANAVLRLGDDIRLERNSYRSFQKSYGKAVGQAAPATFVTLLARKAARADATVTVIPTSLRLSQTCLCGTIARKSLSERVHHCECGITVQRDVWSAYLARFAQAEVGPDGPLWHLDAESAGVLGYGIVPPGGVEPGSRAGVRRLCTRPPTCERRPLRGRPPAERWVRAGRRGSGREGA